VAEPLLRLEKISKSFGAVKALDGVTLEVFPAEVVGLVGDNGAGKSTLVKIAAGVLQPDAGAIYWDGRRVTVDHPDTSRRLGIETLYQDLGLINNLDVVANMFLGRELAWVSPFGLVRVLRSRAMESETRQILDDLGINLGSVREKVEVLSGGQRQAIALGRAVGWGKRLVLLDEPTAALGVRESAQALDLIRRLKERGVSCVLISHNLEHVFTVADRVVVLRQGVLSGQTDRQHLDGDQVVSWITGSAEYQSHRAPGFA
jgi:ABC-type sugar transport system ATPase subunit